MNNTQLKINFSKSTNNYEILYKGFSWISDGRKPYIIVRKNIMGKTVSVRRSFRSAAKKNTDFSENEIVTRYSGFSVSGKKLPIRI